MLSAFAAGRLFGGRSGDGPAGVLALHGWRRSHADFEGILGGEASRGRPPIAAVAPDLPGFGATPEPPAAWGSADYAAVVADAVEEMAAPVVVLGHSFGGRVALHLAARRPELVRALVLTGVPHLVTTAPARRPDLSFRAVRLLNRWGLVGEERMEAARHRHGSPDYRAAAGVMRQVFVRVVQERYDEQLAALRCPVSLVWGAEDHEAPVSVAEQALTRVARANLEVLPGVGHLTPLQAPEALRAALEVHLAGAGA